MNAVLSKPAPSSDGVTPERVRVLTPCRGRLLDVPDAGPLPRRSLAGRRVLLVTGHDDGTAALLRGHGAEIAVTPVAPAEAAALAESFGPDLVVDLNLGATPVTTAGAWRESLERTYAVLGALAPTWRSQRRTRRLAYVAVTRFGGRLGVEPDAVRQPFGGLWAGLVKTIPREWPAVTAKVVDVDEHTDVAVAVATEVVHGRFSEVGWADGRRQVLVPRPDDVDPLDAEATAARTPLLPPWGPGDTVVFLGGGRGIGYEAARALRAATGAHVVVTGRGDLSQVPRELLEADEAAFRAHRDQVLRAAAGGDVRRARQEVERVARLRELHANLTRARAEGAELTYRVCDVTDVAAVRELIASVPGLVAVVHDAGVDTPARLGGKAFAEVARVVSTKVDGFVHVLDALAGRTDVLVCAVGSLTGRFGGTRGQSDYAAANEALARLAEHASARGVPAICLSWPTWDDVGLITNYQAAVREMSPVPVDEGVEAWLAELADPRPGEVLMLAPVGALGPAQETTVPVPSDWPGATAMLSGRHHLGELVAWAPGESLETLHRLRAADLPASAGFLVDGRPSLPITGAVELLMDAALRLVGDPRRRGPVEVRHLRVDLDRLALPTDGTAATLLRSAEVRQVSGTTQVSVRLAPATDDGRQVPGPTLASATVVVGAAWGGGEWSGPSAAEAARADAVQLPDADPVGPAWSSAPGLLARTGSGEDGETVIVRAEPRMASDLATSPHAPASHLPYGPAEALWWAACPSQATAGWWLDLPRLWLGTGDPSRCTLGARSGGDACVWDPDGVPVLRWEGLTWHGRVDRGVRESS